jgi:endo-1,4-beta-xylanase
MVKSSWKRLLSRRKILILGISSTTAIAIAALSKFKLLSYPLDRFQPDRGKVFNYKARKFAVIGKRSLQQRARAKGILYGAFPQADRQKFASNPQLQSSFIRECATITSGYYWTSTRPSINTFNFDETDYFADFAATNKLRLHGHPLVWHEALPKWLPEILASENAQQILTNHIETVVGRYAGKIHSWDVVNEAINIGDKRSDGLRKTPWLEFLGVDYIELAFQLAAKADPQAKLVYNDFGLEYNSPEDGAKRDAVLNLLQQLKSNGAPIYALGLQSHLSGERRNFKPQIFREFLQNVASLGLKIMITELDVTDNKLPLDSNKRDNIIAGVYEDFLSTALAEKSVVSVTSWGLSDRYTWLADKKPRDDRADVRPLPFDRNLKPKLAWNAIARAFDRAPKR